MIRWLVELFHSFPHITFSFQTIENEFLPDDREYLEALGFWAVACLAVGVILLLAIIILWSIRCCCRRPKEPAKRLKKIRKLSNGLFIISLCCFIWLGVALFGNERINRGVTATADSLADLGNDVKVALQKATKINRTLDRNISNSELPHLALVLKNLTVHEHLNKSEVELLMKNASLSVDEALQTTRELNETVSELDSLTGAAQNLDRIENERWIIFAVLLSIMLVVLFAGVVGFCRHSKKAAVLFSGLGMTIFILSWLLTAIVLGVAVAFGDFCANPTPFLLSHFKSNQSREMTEYYISCDQAKSEHPDFVKQMAENIEQDLNQMMDAIHELQKLANSSKQVDDIVGNVSRTRKWAVEMLVGMKTSLSCSSSLRSDYDRASTGLCSVALSGLALLLLGLLLLGLFLFSLLVFVSKAWHLYTKRPLDYVEVDDIEDPFLPRGDRSNIPADFYGTHVYNPRTRFASNNESEPGEGSTPLWGRSTAPPADAL